MPKDASVAVLTKLYRLVQERILVPIFMAEKSCINFREAMDKQNFVIVDLPEGKITSDIANFLGSLILSATYNAAMTREDTPEQDRTPFYLYVDEAYRYTTKSIPEVLQSLRKFKVFMTLASQYLTQYRRDIQDAITQTCETIVSFRVGEDTAKALEKFYPKTYGYQTLMNLPRHLFFVSTPFCGNREYQVLETIDCKTGSNNPDEVINHSLKTYGRQVNVGELLGQVKNQSVQQAFLDWAVTPAEWVVLLTIRLNGGSMTQENLQKQLLYESNRPKSYTLTELGFADALKSLAVDNARRDAWLSFKDETVRQWREETYTYGKKELKTKDVHTRTWRIDFTDRRAKRLLDTVFRGEKAGGVRHVQVIMAQRKMYWQNGWIVRIDDGETDESLADLYVTPTLPASRTEGAKGFIDHKDWDYKRSFAVEVECYPSKHWDRLESNFRRNRKMGFPTVFIVPTKVDEANLRARLFDWRATLVVSAARFEPDHPEMVAIEVVDMLDNQGREVIEADEVPCEPEPIEQTPIELSSYHKPSSSSVSAFEINEPLASSLDSKDVSSQQQERGSVVAVGGGLQRGLVLELAGQGWRFRLKVMRGKLYLCARQGQKERSINLFDEETKHFIEDNHLTVKGYNDEN
jgi:hypothetical protein